MMNFYRIYLTLILFVPVLLNAQNPVDYTQRQQGYIATGGSSLVIQAYQNVPLDNNLLNSKLNDVVTNTTADFTLIELVRVSFLNNGANDAQIVPVLLSIPYWINYSDTLRNYWSENHMIMWMSSDWLMHERYAKPIDANLEARLTHYLQLKIDYGFYEFFSSVYSPYAFSGILNLADFAQDTTIKSLATQAAQRMLKDFLLLTNDQGTFFPAAGRNYPGKYETPYGQNHSSLIYMLMGTGAIPGGPSPAGAFLATSNLPVTNVINTWQPVLDTVHHIGHTLQEGFVLNSTMTEVDRTVFQWSSGAYFHPDVVLATQKLLVDSNMWHHPDFALLQPLSGFSPAALHDLTISLSSISNSSVICGEDVVIYKHNSITLSSIKDFWKGKVGFQEWPCVANIGTTAVYTTSGKIYANWDDKPETNENTHLPYVGQNKNIALIMYRPERTDPLMGSNIHDHKEVALHFNDADFDEVVEDSLWLLGRQGQRYVAVRRPCIATDPDIGRRYCPNPIQQSWVIVVGDSILYNDFTNFQDIVHQSAFTEELYYDSLTSQNVYYAKIVLDNDSIDYAWGRDSVTVGIEENIAAAMGMNIYPNPANDIITIKTQNIQGPCKVEMYSISGQLVYSATGNAQQLQIPVNSLNSGLYAVKLFTANGKVLVKRVVVTD